MVAARQFEVNECKAITTENERIMELRGKSWNGESVWGLINVARRFHNKIIEHRFAYHLLVSVPQQKGQAI